MKLLLIGFMAIASLSVFAEDLVLKIICDGIDSQKNMVRAVISARMNDGKPITSYVGHLNVVEISVNGSVIHESHVAHLSYDGFSKKYSDGSGEFSLNFSSSDEAQKARLYLHRFNSDGTPVGPFYNTLALTCVLL